MRPISLFWIFVYLFAWGSLSNAKAAERQLLRTHVPEVVPRLHPVDQLEGRKRLDLTIGLPLQNREGLTNLLQQIYDPASPKYRQYLTSEQFTERFGPTEQDYRTLIAFAKSSGLTVQGTHRNRALLHVNGPVSAIEKTFHVKMRVYRHPMEARTFYAPDVEPSLDLTTPVLAISGLDDFFLPRPMSLRTNLSNKSSSVTPSTAGSGPRGTFIGSDFRAAYAPGVLLDGAGQSVGLFELDGYYSNDIAAYAALAGLPAVPLTNVLLNGFSGTPGLNNVEVALDIDMVIAMAPGLSKIIVYEGRVPNDVLNRMATDNEARQLSSSWSFGSKIDPARQQIFQQFAAQGQSFFQASGDLGAAAAAIPPPADDPFVTVVGGTALATNPGGSWGSESAWIAGGGGISPSYTIPIWQHGIDMSANQGSTLMRNIPDVACLSDDVIWLVANNGEQGISGGTSVAAPLWAGFTALVNQQAAASGKPNVGFINPAIYAIGRGSGYGSGFHDITTGNNTNSGSPNKFFAVPGYDLCTGWGTPTGSNLITALLAPGDALRISPEAILTFTGPAGGPFSPAAQMYSLTNDSPGYIDWALVTTAPWLDLSPTSGTLTSGGPGITVTVTLKSEAANLSVGSYAATVLLTNLSGGFGQSRRIALEIVATPVITSQPASQAVLEGTTVAFTVGTASNGALSYQWRQDNGTYLTNLSDGGNFSGAATSTLTVSNVSPDTVGAYSVMVSNASGVVTSSNAFLAIVPFRPVIAAQPSSQSALPGQTVIFTVGVIGTLPLSYHWRESGNNLADIGRLSGTATSSLIISNVSSADAGTYSVVVSNAFGVVPSSNAVLTIVPVTAPGMIMETLYSFSGDNDGANPNGLVLGSNGKFYGTTQHGGTNSSGTIFQMSADGLVAPLYSFTGGSDGANPFAPLVESGDGNFFGSVFQGGAYDNGAIFRIAPDGLFTPVMSFNGTNGDFPLGGLTLGAGGDFFGTSYQGGSFGRGTVFRMTSNGVLTNLYSFANGGDGGHPSAGLLTGGDGSFYGTTYKGGQFGRGTVFRITTDGALTRLTSFNSTNGSLPYAGLVLGTDGNLYGATVEGGAYNHGTIFRITTDALLTALYSFTGGSDGDHPAGGLLQSSDGNFYGTTAYGGAYGDGTLFRISPSGALTTLLQFDGYNGANPQTALVEGADGRLYGSAQNGGANGQGVLFRLGVNSAPEITTQPADQAVFEGETVMFSVAVFGSAPLFYQWRENGTNLADGGKISATRTRILRLSNVSTNNAGTYSVIVSNALNSTISVGALLQVTSSPPFIVTQPISRTLSPGTNATLTVKAFGNLPLFYQWQRSGTNISDGGNVSGTATSSLNFTSITEANNGTYSVIVSNALNSISSSGAGLTVVPVSAPGTRLATLHWFSRDGPDGPPNGLTLGSNGNLYGTTQFGGASRFGRVFSLGTNGTFNTLASFVGGTNGSIPRCGVVQGADGNFYGTTQFGGSSGVGEIFKISPEGVLVPLYSFTGADDGAYPLAALIQGADGNFYGTTQDGGTLGAGTVFKITPDGALTSLHSFANAEDGSSPDSALVQGRDGYFYGVTGGGAHGFGNVFKMTSAGAFTTVYNFTNGTDGSAPSGALVQGTDGNLYGVTKRNTIQGFPFNGTIFKMTTNGLLTTLYALNFTDGAIPTAGLVQGSDGNFYGTTDSGGATSNGTVFRISPTGSLATLVSFDGFDDGAHPGAALVESADGTLYGTTTSGGPGGQGTVFRLAITSAPQITSQPANQLVLAGANATISVAVFGAPPLFYHWRKNGIDLTDGVNLSGATSRVLTLTNVSSANNGTYSVVVSNALNSVTSSGGLMTAVFAPMVQSVIQTNGAVRFVWSAQIGQRYRVQFKTNLATVAWTNLGSIITATTAVVTTSDNIGPDRQRFYRVILVP